MRPPAYLCNGFERPSLASISWLPARQTETVHMRTVSRARVELDSPPCPTQGTYATAEGRTWPASGPRVREGVAISWDRVSRIVGWLWVPCTRQRPEGSNLLATRDECTCDYCYDLHILPMDQVVSSDHAFGLVVMVSKHYSNN